MTTHNKSASVEVPCPSTYGVIVCQFPHGVLRQALPHSATLASGRQVRWGNGCDGTCTVDCGWCKGALRTLAGIGGADEHGSATSQPSAT